GNVGRPDTPGVSSAEMQRILDELPREVIIPKFNGLVEALESTAADASGAGGVGVSEIEGAAGADVQAVLESLRAAGREAEEALLLRVIAVNDAVKYLRVNADRVLETSADGTNWQATGSSGHIVEDWTGAALPQRGRLRFAGMEVTDDPVSGTTEVQGLGVKLADRAPTPGVPLHCVLKPVGIAPPVPAEGRADGVTLAADAESGVWRVEAAPKLMTPRKIGNAEFDGGGDITLGEMGFAYQYENITSYTLSGSVSSIQTSGLHVFRYGPVVLFSTAIKGNAAGTVTFDLGITTDYTLNFTVQIDTTPNCIYATLTTAGKLIVNLANTAYHRTFGAAIAKE
ncbi:hypothetical protein H8S23_05110, partial [Anaerofilum sp. BX8]